MFLNAARTALGAAGMGAGSVPCFYKEPVFRECRLFTLLPLLWALIFFCGCGQARDPCQPSSVEEIAGCRVGVQVGSTADQGATALLDRLGYADMLERFNSSPDAVTAMKQGKIDLVIVDHQPALEFLRKNPDLVILDFPFAQETFAGAVALERPDLLAEINQALIRAEEMGIPEKLRQTFVEHQGDYHYVQKNQGGAPLVMATNAQFPPYEYFEGGQVTGYEVELARAVADLMGRQLRIEEMEFDAVISAVAAGKADFAFAGLSVTEDRQKSVNFTRPLVTTRISVLARSGMAAASAGEEAERSLSQRFHDNFIEQDRWLFIARGLGITLLVAFLSTLCGFAGGFVLAVIRSWHDRNGGLAVPNFLAVIYINVIRGTPVMIQLLIIYYLIFAAVDVSKILVAVAAFGLNSAAYSAEIIRGGIMAVDRGQFEAGRTLGLSPFQIYRHIVLPQAVKKVLPALGNESISLLKETSISGYIGLADLTRGGVIIRSITYEAFMPLMAVALIYLILIGLMSFGVSRLERRLRRDER